MRVAAARPRQFDVRREWHELACLFLRLRRFFKLYAGTQLIASYRRLVVTTSVGPSHGLLEYLFDHDAFLTEVIVTLCLNRWIDTHAFGTSTSFQHV